MNLVGISGKARGPYMDSKPVQRGKLQPINPSKIRNKELA